jgi:hypothetical protein
MFRWLAGALLLALVSSPAMAATQLYKCTVNGSVNYQQSPCPSTEARKPPTVEELNAERQKKLAQEKESPASAVVPQAGTGKRAAPASPGVAERAPGNVYFSPSASFKCDGRTYCSQMTSCAEAKYFLAHCPGVKMDGDGDGVPCEEQFCGH